MPAPNTLGISSIYQTPYNVKNPTYPGATLAALGDGTTDDGPAILACVRACYASGKAGVVYFPAGIYRVAYPNTNIFNIATPNSAYIGYAASLKFVGEGKFNTIVRMDTTGATADCWIMQLSRSFTTYIGASWQDMSFQGGAPDSDGGWQKTSIATYAKGFEIFGSNTNSVQNQSFRFLNVHMAGFQKHFAFEGDAVASEVAHFGCTYNFSAQAFYYIDNPQSVNHSFYGTDIEEHYGDIFQYSAGASGLNGGSIHVYGGSIILENYSGRSTNGYIVSMPSAVIVDPISFHGSRFELRGNFTNPVKIADLGQIRATFTDCRFLDAATASKTAWIAIGRNANIVIEGGEIVQQNAAATNVVVNSNSVQGEVGTVFFERVRLPSNFSDQCSLSNWSGGLIAARQCSGNTSQGSNATEAVDFQLNPAFTLGQVGAWSSAQLAGDANTAGIQPVRRIAWLKNAGQYWPSSSGQELTTKLPKNAIILGFHLRYPGGGLSGGTGVYLRITNNDYSVLHTSASVGTGATAASIDVDNYFYAVNSTTTARTLRVSLGPNSASASSYTGITGSNGGGFGWIEYV